MWPIIVRMLWPMQVQKILFKMHKQPKKPHDREALKKAVNEVQVNGLAVRAAAKLYGVPRTSLQFQLKNPGHKDTKGPASVLTTDEEATLVR